MDAKDWRFPTICPACNAKAGRPVRVAKPALRIEISVRCDACAQEWTIDCDDPPLILIQKPDRRSLSE
jgi:hypothetical protein